MMLQLQTTYGRASPLRFCDRFSEGQSLRGRLSDKDLVRGISLCLADTNFMPCTVVVVTTIRIVATHDHYLYGRGCEGNCGDW